MHLQHNVLNSDRQRASPSALIVITAGIVKKRAFFGGMQYRAYAGRADNPESFLFNRPFTMSGK